MAQQHILDVLLDAVQVVEKDIVFVEKTLHVRDVAGSELGHQLMQAILAGFGLEVFLQGGLEGDELLCEPRGDRKGRARIAGAAAMLWRRSMGRRFLVAALVLGLVACSAPQEVSFPTQDGGVVFADVYGDAARTLILAHGGRLTKESWAPQAPVLRRAGFRVVAIDFRGRGRSGPARDEGYEHDVLAAVRWARQTGATSVAVVGASFGGWAAARAVARSPGEIDRVVLLASGAEEPQALSGRTLFIVARDDTRGEGIPRLPEIREAYEAAPEPKELVVLDGAAHAQFLFDSDQGGRLLQEIERFLTEP